MQLHDLPRELAASLCAALLAPTLSLDALQDICNPPLRALGLLERPGQSTSSPWDRLGNDELSYFANTQLAEVQKILATKIVVDWRDQLQRAQLWRTVWLPFYCPKDVSSAYAKTAALSAYNILLQVLSSKDALAEYSTTRQADFAVHPLVREVAISTLAELSTTYSLVTMYQHIHGVRSDSRSLLAWQAFVDVYLAVPLKVSNALGGQASSGLEELEWRRYMHSVTIGLDDLVAEAARRQSNDLDEQALAYLLGKTIRSGYISLSSDQLSFWTSILGSGSDFLARMFGKKRNPCHAALWHNLVQQLTTADLTTFATSLVQALEFETYGQERSMKAAQASSILARMLGYLGDAGGDDDQLWDIVVIGCFLRRHGWTERVAIILVSWVALTAEHAQDKRINNEALKHLLGLTLDLWSDKQIIESASASYHYYLSAILVLGIKLLPQNHPSIVSLSRSPAFLTGITSHLSSMRNEIRFSGMYIAELVSEKSVVEGVGALHFGDAWDEKESGMGVVQKLKALREIDLATEDDGDWRIHEDNGSASESPKTSSAQAPKSSTSTVSPKVQQDRGDSRGAQPTKIQVIASDYDDYDNDVSDDEDLVPYSLPAAPPVEQLQDLDDVSTYTAKKDKVQPPIYIPDLVSYLRAHDNVEKLDIALTEAQTLIRRKATWGTELADNAVELTFILSGLQDNFELANFEERRRAALTALLSCSPERSAPTLIEQYYTHSYSVQQRYAMLSSLALSARELAGLPSLLPPPAPGAKTDVDVSFASQRLPVKLHDHFLSSKQKTDRNGLTAVGQSRELDAITESITRAALTSSREEAEATIPQASREKMLTVRKSQGGILISSAAKPAQASGKPAFSSLATETFIMPFINRFWLYLRDAAISPQQRQVGPFAGGGGGGMPSLLDPIVLSKYLGTLSVLIDASRNSPHFLAVLAPETLELVLALRDTGASEAVRTSLLQLALVVLDTSTSIDSGRTLARDFGKSTWQIKDWAEETWSAKEQTGAGQIDDEGKAAAGLLLRLDGVVQKTIGFR